MILDDALVPGEYHFALLRSVSAGTAEQTKSQLAAFVLQKRGQGLRIIHGDLPKCLPINGAGINADAVIDNINTVKICRGLIKLQEIANQNFLEFIVRDVAGSPCEADNRANFRAVQAMLQHQAANHASCSGN